MIVRSLFSFAAGVGLMVGGSSLAQHPNRLPLAAPATNSASNQKLADTVAGQLRSSGTIRGYTIDISAIDGRVELTGRVADAIQHDEVLRIVLGVPGVMAVVDNMMTANFQPVIRPVQNSDPATLPPPISKDGAPIAPPLPPGGIVPVPMGPAVTDPLPIVPGNTPYDLNPPKMPPYAWPSYAPYNNFGRVAYPTQYPYNAWPFIGPFYPFPKVPPGWRSVTLEWEDGHWYYGRNAHKHDYWRVRFW